MSDYPGLRRLADLPEGCCRNCGRPQADTEEYERSHDEVAHDEGGCWCLAYCWAANKDDCQHVEGETPIQEIKDRALLAALDGLVCACPATDTYVDKGAWAKAHAALAALDREARDA